MSKNQKELVLSSEAIHAIAQEAVNILKKQLLLDDQIEIAPDQLNQLAEKISSRMDATVDYDKIRHQFKNYELTDQDRVDIAEKALLDLDLSDDIRATLARSFVSKSFFNEKIGALRQFVQDNKVRKITAGISGKEMIAEINKVLGTDWQDGGGGDVVSVDGRVGVVTLGDLYELVFAKNTAFNKDFGSGAGDVAEGSLLAAKITGPGSSTVDQIAIASDVNGNVSFSPVTIDPSTRKMAGLGVTEQDGTLYLKTNQFVRWTTTGLSGGTIKGDMFVDTNSFLYLRIGTNVKISISSTGLVTVTNDMKVSQNLDVIGELDVSGSLFTNSPSGATQAAAGAAAGEEWITSGHATLPDNVKMIGV